MMQSVALSAVITAVSFVPAWSLCGDLSGDGYVRATDALAALELAVGGGYDGGADVGSSDGRVTATDALMILRAAVDGNVPPCALAERRAFVTLAACDFVTGGIAAVDLDSRSVTGSRFGTVAADSVVRTAGERVFVIGRFGADTVAEIDPTTLDTLWECSVGPGTNPHDFVLVAPDRAYVSRYDSARLAIVDPTAGPSCAGFVRGTVDLSSLADNDGFPEMDQMTLVGSHLLVALQRLDRNDFFQPAAHGALAVVDTATDSLTGSVELSIDNPFAETKGLLVDPTGKRVYVGGPGRLFSDLDDGGIEVIDAQSLTSTGIVISGAELGGDLTDFVVAGDGRVFAVVADASFVASVVDVDLRSRTVSRVLMRSDTLISDVELSQSGQLWVSDRNCLQPGLRTFSIATGAELTSKPLYPGLTPFNLVLSPM